MYPIAEHDASQARIKGLLKLGYRNTGAVIKACFNVLKAFSQSRTCHWLWRKSFDKYRKELFSNRTRIAGIGFSNLLLFSYLFSKFYF
jgi:hypothetical protein